MVKLYKIPFFAAVAFITGCAVPTNTGLFSTAPEKNYTSMYLRGVFNWWDATEAFKFKAIDKDTLIVDIELIADGQPYDFKVADDTWSPDFNCGLASQSMPMNLNNQVELYCFNDSLNLQFIPLETAVYRFELDISNNKYPELSVTVAN